MPSDTPKKRGRKPADDKPKPRETDRHTKPRKAFHAEQALFDAVEAYRKATKPRPSEAAIFIIAVEEYLERHGFWPPK